MPYEIVAVVHLALYSASHHGKRTCYFGEIVSLAVFCSPYLSFAPAFIIVVLGISEGTSLPSSF